MSQAQHNAQELIELQGKLGFPDEEIVRRVLVSNPGVEVLMNGVYYAAHLSTVIALFLWTWHRRPDAYPFVRNTFALTQLAVVAIYLLRPTSPPAFRHEFSPEQAADFAYNLQYAHAAFPSGHVAFACVVALGLLVARPPLLIRLVGIAYALFMAWLVIATGNHYWLDVLAGLALTLFAGTVSRQLGKADAKQAASESKYVQSLN